MINVTPKIGQREPELTQARLDNINELAAAIVHSQKTPQERTSYPQTVAQEIGWLPADALGEISGPRVRVRNLQQHAQLGRGDYDRSLALIKHNKLRARIHALAGHSRRIRRSQVRCGILLHVRHWAVFEDAAHGAGWRRTHDSCEVSRKAFNHHKGSYVSAVAIWMRMRTVLVPCI